MTLGGGRQSFPSAAKWAYRLDRRAADLVTSVLRSRRVLTGVKESSKGTPVVPAPARASPPPELVRTPAGCP